MNKNILPLLLAGFLILLAVFLMIPTTNQTILSLLGIDTQGKSAVSSDFDAFIPFIPGYFPEDFSITSVGTAVDEGPGKNTYSEFYASDTYFYKIIQSQGEEVPVIVPNSAITIQDNPASLTDQVDVVGLIGGDLDLNQYSTSQVWMLSVVMKEINVQVVSNQPRDEVIRFAMELIPQYCIYTPTPEA
jgi:hypothetical protein